jgi:hypothetical protein
MKHHPATVWRHRVLVAVLAVVATATTAWADAIQFSKPVIEIATPDKEQPSLPKARSKAVDISSPDQMEAPIAAPPPMVRPKTRDRDDDDDTGRHPLLRNPAKFPDAVGRDNERNPKLSSTSRKSSDSQSSSAYGRNGKETDQSLSPITNPDWDLRDRDSNRDSDRHRKDPFSANLTTKSERKDRTDRNDSRQKDAYESREQDEPGRADGLNSTAFDSFTFRAKENPTSAQVERRAAFDQLLNPSGSPGRQAGSLEPVSGLESPKPTTPIGMPMLGGGMFDKSSAGPSEAFKAQPNRPHAPVAEDLAKRFSLQSKPAVTAPVDARFESSLMRQPTVHDIPSRKF